LYAIYINEFLRNGSTVTTEEKMYDIPAYYPEHEMLIDPKVKTEMGKASTFEFSMEVSNPWYSCLMQMRTRMRVVYDGKTIFYGRVLSIDTDLYGKRSVHCEGALAFFNDTLMEATKEDEREKISLETYVSDLITTHNNLVEEWKRFELGEVPGNYSNAVNDEQKLSEEDDKKFGTSSWTSIMNCLEELTSQYGGYWNARYENGKNYIDWLKDYINPTKNNQPIEVGSNVVDLSNTVDLNNIFTILIPEGSKNGESIYLDDHLKHTVKTPVVTPKDEGEEEEEPET